MRFCIHTQRVYIYASCRAGTVALCVKPAPLLPPSVFSVSISVSVSSSFVLEKKKECQKQSAHYVLLVFPPACVCCCLHVLLMAVWWCLLVVPCVGAGGERRLPVHRGRGQGSLLRYLRLDVRGRGHNDLGGLHDARRVHLQRGTYIRVHVCELGEIKGEVGSPVNIMVRSSSCFPSPCSPRRRPPMTPHPCPGIRFCSLRLPKRFVRFFVSLATYNNTVCV